MPTKGGHSLVLRRSFVLFCALWLALYAGFTAESPVTVVSPVLAAPAPDWDLLSKTGDRLLEAGVQGDDVLALQKLLQQMGYLKVAPTGYYGDLTIQAVQAFQREHQVQATGKVGPTTRGALRQALRPQQHTVQPGENLTAIAARYDLTLDELVSYNQLADADQIYAGQQLRLSPPPKPAAAAPNPAPSQAAQAGQPAQPARGSRGEDEPLMIYRGTTAAGSALPAAKRLALTFDDGPDPAVTPRVLELLKKHNARATFFVLGSKAEQYPELIRQIVADGHEIANHTYRHVDLTQLKPEELVAELEQSARVLEQLSGRAPRWFRPPKGAFNDRVVEAAWQRGQRLALWTNIGPQNIAPPVLARRTIAAAREGAVLMLHDDRAEVLQVLELVLPRLGQDGFRAVTLSELAES